MVGARQLSSSRSTLAGNSKRVIIPKPQAQRAAECTDVKDKAEICRRARRLATGNKDTVFALHRYLTGQEAVRVYAETEQEIHSAYEDLLIGTVRMADSTIGMLDINWVTPTKIRELTVTGKRGMFLVDHLTQDLYLYENAEANDERWSAISLLRGVSEGRMIRYPVRKYEPLKAELEGFVRAVTGDKPVPVDGEDGLAALRLAQALIQSGREGRPITFK